VEPDQDHVQVHDHGRAPDRLRTPALRAALALALLACDDARPPHAPPPDAARDASIPDAAVDSAPPACDEPLLANDKLRLLRCPDGARYAVAAGDGSPLLVGATAAVTLEGRRLRTRDWPEAAWVTVDERRVQARFTGLAGIPDLVLWLTLGEALYVDVWLEAPAQGTPLEVERIEALVLDDTDAVATVDPGSAPSAWRLLPPEPGPVVAPGPPLARPTEQVVAGPGRSLLLGALVPADGDLLVTVGASGALDRLEVDTAGPPATLAPGTRVRAPTLALRVGPDPLALMAAHAADVAAPTGAPPRPSPGWGWRSGPAYGALVNADVLLAEARALNALAAAQGVAPPAWIVADGLWYRALGDWSAGEGFPDGLAPVAAALGAEGARLGLTWPATWVADEAPVYARDPEWLLRAADGSAAPCGAACGVLDPARPGARDHLGRDAAALRAEGVGLLLLDGLAEATAAGTPAVREAGATLRAAIGGALLGAPAADAWPLAGLADVSAVAPPPLSELGADCAAGDRADPGPRDPACGEALRSLTPAAAAPAADTLRARAFALAASWHRGGTLTALDAGPVLVAARPAGEARQAAAIAAIAGGPYLLGDSPTALDPERAALALAPLRAGLPAGAARPLDLFAGGDDPPSTWRGAGVLALFNWTDAPRRVEGLHRIAPGFGAARSVFDHRAWPDLDAVPGLDVPPRDVVVLVRALE
jgi:hypothetical protein